MKTCFQLNNTCQRNSNKTSSLAGPVNAVQKFITRCKLWTGGVSVQESNEEELYQSVVEALKSYFVGKKGVDATFWITSRGIPEEVRKLLKSEILFLVDKEFRPDIMGVLRLPTQQITQQQLVTVEVKNRVDLRAWFQAKNYGDLYDAKIALLVSPAPMPEKIRRLIEVHPALRYRFMSGHSICYARVDKIERILSKFFPEEPLL
jgi:hypothetical protein